MKITRDNSALVTALMPLKYYNEPYLHDSIESLLSQHDPNWRLLIIVEVADYFPIKNQLAFFLKDDRIKVKETDAAGFIGRINTGMLFAKTEFTSLLFADDKWSRDAVSVLNQNIRSHPDVDFFHSSRVIIDEKGAEISPVFKSKIHFDTADFKWGSPVKHLLCWRRTKGLEIGGVDPDLADHGPDDYDFPWSMLDAGATFRAIEECLYYYRNHCEYYRLTTHVPRQRMKREVKKILKKHGVGWLEREIIIWRRIWTGSLGGQSLYRNSLEQWLSNRFNLRIRRKWRQIEY